MTRIVPSSPRAAMCSVAPGGGAAGVVCVEGDCLAGFGVGGVAEADGVLLAAAFGDWGGAAEGGGFVGVGGAVEQGSDFSDDLAEADGADAGERPEQLSFGV